MLACSYRWNEDGRGSWAAPLAAWTSGWAVKAGTRSADSQALTIIKPVSVCVVTLS